MDEEVVVTQTKDTVDEPVAESSSSSKPTAGDTLQPASGEAEDRGLSSGPSEPAHSSSSAPSRSSSSAPSSREDTPNNQTTYQYSRVQLKDLERAPASLRRPDCLSPDFFTEAGVWDPERWFLSFMPSRGESPFPRDRKRQSDFDKDSHNKKRPTTDPKLRVQEEGDDIVLSPQGRSFKTGCHVTQSSAAPPPRRAASPTDRKREERKAGSGRIQLADRSERDYHDVRGRYEREPRDHERDLRERESADHRERREYGMRDRDPRDHDPRDHRDRDPRDRDLRDRGPRDRDPRDWDRDHRDDRRNFDRGFPRRFDRQDRRYDGRGRYRRQEDDDEPEWYSAGPTSQNDVIELHGFGGLDASKIQTDSVPAQKEPGKPVEERRAGKEVTEAPEKQGKTVTVSPPADAAVTAAEPDFDFNDIFNIDNIPGLLVNAPMMEPTLTGGSRFSQWFAAPAASSAGVSAKGSRENSRRSSLTDEFSYLQELVSGGNKTPEQLVPGAGHPGPDHQHHQHRLFSPIANPSELQQQQLMEHILGSAQPPAPQAAAAHDAKTATDRQQLEANLKAMLFHGQSTQAQPPAHLQVAGGKVTTVAELEADMKDVTLHGAEPRSQGHQRPPVSAAPPPAEAPGEMAAFNKLLGLMKRAVDGRISPASVLAATQQLNASTQASHINQRQKQELLQKLLQQQQLQQIRAQQQQVKIQQQQQLQDHILKMVQQQQQGPRPAAAPPSPLPPGLTLPGLPASPRPTTPNPVTTLLAPPTSPRAPSPIMFGSQPPMHLQAPAPIHPAGGQSSAQTLTVPGQPVPGSSPSPVPPRVPSPQELIVHTQAIMQNALIKKQLEDQKERFIRKQHSDPKVKSPISSHPPLPQYMAASLSATASGPPNAEFVPSSVMKKLAGDRADLQKPLHSPPTIVEPADDPAMTSSSATSTTAMLNLPRVAVSAEEGEMTLAVPPNAQQQAALLRAQQEALLRSKAGQQGRAIVKGAGGSNAMSPPTQHRTLANQTLQQQLLPDQLKQLLDQQRLQQQQQQLAQSAVTSQPAQVNQLRSLLPGVRSVVPPHFANNVMLQRMMTPGAAPQQLNTASQLAMLQAAVQQQRSLDPRVPAPGLLPQAGVNPLMAAANQRAAIAGLGVGAGLGAGNPALSRALQQGGVPGLGADGGAVSAAASSGGRDNNLSKWFGNDMFKQPLGALPTLPTHGQKVLTLEEIERHQQAVSN